MNIIHIRFQRIIFHKSAADESYKQSVHPMY